ncbi:Rad52/Rad22 family DNA repair protein [uncultured Ruegeria sp.]|uniref:Rad52/Rad22 family DNA repair protein n=1 Tax=uncultured Ruegeria sp. TaxID=259304 RepID=UPI00261BA285|nr:Rad52/Rad22 family DNA repair protein [uncultured Ruegeria sp.]
MDFKKLSEEFPRESVSWRVQGTPYERNGRFSAMALAYIDARDVMDRLDEVCGPDNWQDEYTTNANGLTICRIGIRVTDEWVWKSDGAGETAVEGQKGGISDALKRAAVHWGIGRYLYRLDSPWVACAVKQKGNKTYWREWTEDPWSKVKNAPYNAAEDARNKQADDAMMETALGNINGAQSLDDLKAIWSDLNHNQHSLAEDADVIAAKDQRKSELMKEAA